MMSPLFRKRFDDALDATPHSRSSRWVWLVLLVLAWITFLPSPRAVQAQTLFEQEQRLGEQIAARLQRELVPLVGEQNLHAQARVTLSAETPPSVVSVDTTLAVDARHLERQGDELRNTLITLGQDIAGFKAERGDRFTVIAKPPVNPFALVQRAPVHSVELVMAGILAALASFLGLNLLRRPATQGARPSLPVATSASMEEPGYAALIANARAAVRQNPDAVAAVVHRWMNEDGR